VTISCNVDYIYGNRPEITVNTVRNQIDYMLINKKYQKSIREVAAYPSADKGSDQDKDSDRNIQIQRGTGYKQKQKQGI